VGTVSPSAGGASLDLRRMLPTRVKTFSGRSAGIGGEVGLGWLYAVVVTKVDTGAVLDVGHEHQAPGPRGR
jgi:hypothetical protein